MTCTTAMATGPGRKPLRGPNSPLRLPWTGVPDALREYLPGLPAQEPRDTNLRLVRKETIGGVLTFVYEDRFHPGGVDTRTQTDDIWVGANDHLPRKVQTVLVTNQPGIAEIIQSDTATWSYKPPPEIKPPM